MTTSFLAVEEYFRSGDPHFLEELRGTVEPCRLRGSGREHASSCTRISTPRSTRPATSREGLRVYVGDLKKVEK